jgi:hypothetical protein
MGRLFILVIFSLFSFSPLVGPLVSGQETETANWNGVTLSEEAVDPGPLEVFLIGVPLDGLDANRTRSVGTRLEGGFQFDFQYDRNVQSYRPQVPEIEDTQGRKDAELMVVIVDSGEFVLTILPSSPAFIVDPPEGQTISYMEVTGNWADPPDPGFEYSVSNEVVRDEKGQVEALAGNFCLWCLINGQENPSGQEEGSLLVYPNMENDQEFSWERSYNESRNLASPDGVEYLQGDPTSSEAAPVRMAWAYNPGSGCR